MITAGIDGGSRAVKVAIWNQESKRILGTAIGDQGIDHDRAAESLFAQALEHEIDHLNGTLFIDHIENNYSRQLSAIRLSPAFFNKPPSTWFLTRKGDTGIVLRSCIIASKDIGYQGSVL